MRGLSCLVAVATLLLLCAHPAFGQEKTRVMVLGVAHLVARHDFHNSVFQDDPLSAKRQAEVEDVVNRLSRFHPTKVLVEGEMGSKTLPGQYAQYLAGRFSLPANEIYQFGFKTAKASGNRAIYPVDTFGPPFLNENGRIDAYLKAHFTDIRDPRFDAFVAHSDDIERHGTYLDLLRYLNTDEAILANASSYSALDGMGRDADNAGAAYVSQWYARNVYIFSNIVSVIKPGDRVLVIFGQGHEYLLRELVRLHPSLVDVDPLLFLK